MIGFKKLQILKDFNLVINTLFGTIKVHTIDLLSFIDTLNETYFKIVFLDSI